MAEDKAEKTIKATPRKLNRAKEHGDLPRSQEFPNLTAFLFIILFLLLFAHYGINALQKMMVDHFRNISSLSVTHDGISEIMSVFIFKALIIMSPFFVWIILFTAILSTMYQGGWVFTFKPFKFNPGRFSPAKGLKKILASKQSWMNLGRAVLTTLIIGLIAWQSVLEYMPTLPMLDMMTLPAALTSIFGFIFYSLLKLSIFFIIVAVLDLAFTKYQYAEKQKMTRKEFTDEQKNMEGDPKIKKRIRTVQYQMHRRRMMSSVPEADVVVTNPTHIAVALRYDLEKAPAPEVLAAGRGHLANRIRKLAEENDIPLVENPPLAQTLLRTCEVGDVVPPDLYKAVAEVLAYVYKLKGKVPA